jgi:hypothetical protein
MTTFRLSAASLLAAASLVGCGGGSGGDGSSGGNPPPAQTTYTAVTGVAQKGPLILGSTVTIQELNANLVPTGKQYSYQTHSNLGAFTPSSAFTSQYLGVSATGYYFDENTASVSGGPITLNAYADLSASTALNVNLLTTLAYRRIENLVASSQLTFAAARSQAEREVLAALKIRDPGAYNHFTALDLSGGADGDKILAATSSVFTYGNSAANLSALIAQFQNDLGTNGRITSTATDATLTASAQALNSAVVAANLNQKYSSAGVSFAATDIANWLDQDGDGLVGKYEFRVADASQSSVFALPSWVTDSRAGAEISISAGRLSVNGTPVAGTIQIHAGDVVALSPPSSSAFPAGTVTAYLLSGAVKLARVTFVSGLQSLIVTPAGASIPIGVEQLFAATGTFTDGSTADLTANVSWTSSSPAIATASATGAVTAIAVGSTTINAASGSISGFATLNVVGAALQSISVVPSPISIGVGVARQLTATGHYSDGSSGDLTATATWSAATPAVAAVTGGRVTGASVGTTEVTATSGAVAGGATVNVTSNTWTPAAPDAMRTNHTATLLSSGKVLVAFGAGFGACCSSSARIYDPITDMWASGGSWTFGLQEHTATLLADGRVLVAGGDGNGPVLRNAEVYDPAANSWSAVAMMANGRLAHTATLLPSGKVLVAGGPATAELYDPVANAWSAAGTLSLARRNPSATLLPNGKVLVTGGGNGAAVESVTSAEIYDPVANSWSQAGHMATARQGHAATLLSNGTVLVAGGYNSTVPGGRLTSAEIYNPVTNTWSPAASMAIARSNHTATTLAGGRILVVGGNENSHITTTSEIYDPGSNSWSPAPNLVGYHLDHTATRLPSGAVLIVGGNTWTAELYW